MKNYVIGILSVLFCYAIGFLLYYWGIDSIRFSFGEVLPIIGAIVLFIFALIFLISGCMIVVDMLTNENKKYGLFRIIKLALNKFAEYDY
jgi:hypothetical protein